MNEQQLELPLRVLMKDGRINGELRRQKNTLEGRKEGRKEEGRKEEGRNERCILKHMQ